MGTELKKTDSEIQKDVLRELEWDTRVSATDVGVQVKGGIVTLAGGVDSWAKLRAAEQAAHRVPGVLDVASDLTVRLSGQHGRTDTEIAQAVRRSLEWDVLVPDKNIRSTVSSGVVTLDGTVGYFSQRADAERAIERLAGVKSVVNRIEVRPHEQASLGDVRDAVEKALEWHAEREAARIAVSVSDGTVDIRGVVHTWPEKEAVLGAARGSRGVRAVSDHLKIQPYA